jgi:hypothetical protein
MDNLKRALSKNQKVLNIQESVLDQNYSDTANTYKNIGSLLVKSKDCTGMLEMFHKALAVKETVFGGDHPEMAMTYNNLGMVLAKISGGLQWRFRILWQSSFCSDNGLWRRSPRHCGCQKQYRISEYSSEVQEKIWPMTYMVAKSDKNVCCHNHISNQSGPCDAIGIQGLPR